MRSCLLLQQGGDLFAPLASWKELAPGNFTVSSARNLARQHATLRESNVSLEFLLSSPQPGHVRRELCLQLPCALQADEDSLSRAH